jgi:monoamine oxidase
MAGLNCAYQLKKSGLKAAVYEASNRTGGRIYSQKNVLDAGLITNWAASLSTPSIRTC